MSIEPDDVPEADDAIRAVVARLSRPHPSGGNVIERAAILAEGADSAAILSWIAAHSGQPEALAAARRRAAEASTVRGRRRASKRSAARRAATSCRSAR